MSLVRQAVSFGAIGICATLTHVGLAGGLMQFTPINAYLANLAGAATAFAVSFLGNARFTFGVSERLAYYGMRYLGVSAVSLLLTTIELNLVEHLGLSTLVYVATVLLTVPPATFLLAKWWAFSQARA